MSSYLAVAKARTTHTWLAPLYALLDLLFGSSWAPVRVVTAAGLPANTYVTGTQTKTANANGALNDVGIDGVTTLAVGDRVWDKNATGSERGLFVITALGVASTKWAMKRAPDAAQSLAFVNGKQVCAGSEGSTNGGITYHLTNATFTLDTTTPAIGAAHTSGGTTGGTGIAMCGAVNFAAPPAGETTAVSNTAQMANVALTIAAQPAYPCKLTITETVGGAAVTAGILTLIGVGAAGDAINEVLTLNAATHTFTTANAFAHLTSATISALSPTGDAANTIAIGQATALALNIPVGATSVVVNKANVAATGSAVGVNDTVGTVDTTARTIVPNTAANGTKCFQFWFSYVTPTHTHTEA